MGVVPEKAFVSREVEPGVAGTASAPAQRPAGDPLNYDDLLLEYNQLRERSGRTTIVSSPNGCIAFLFRADNALLAAALPRRK